MTPTSCTAAPFQFTSAGTDLKITVGGTLHNVTVPSCLTRILCGFGAIPGTTEPLCDFLQVVQAALNAGGTTLTWTVTMSPVTGQVTLAANGAFTFQALGTIKNLLGGLNSATGVTAVTSVYAPPYLALFAGRQAAGDWVDETTVAAAEDGVGDSYVITSGLVRWTDELTWSWILRDAPTQIAYGESCSPWHPDPAYLATPGVLSTARVWSVADQRAVSYGKVLGFGRGTFPALCASTSNGALYDLVTIPGADLAKPRKSNPFVGIGLSGTSPGCTRCCASARHPPARAPDRPPVAHDLPLTPPRSPAMAHTTYVQPATVVPLPATVPTDLLGTPPVNGRGVAIGSGGGLGADVVGITLAETTGTNPIDHVQLYVAANDDTNYVPWGADLGPVAAHGTLAIDRANIPYAFLRLVCTSTLGAAAGIAVRAARLGA